MKEQKIIQLSERDHILLRPSLWIGSVSKSTSEEFILEKEKFEKKEISYVPGLVKIVNEIIDNSVDEAVRTKYQFSNKIRIDVDTDSVRIWDNGRGIPVKQDNSGIYMPELAFCNARAGSNFEDDEERITAGLNGVGATLTNVYSNYFEVQTSDGEQKFTLICKDNLGEKETKVRKNGKKFTEVFFKPDLKRFGLEEIDQDHLLIIKQRILFLSITHPQIKFYFNKKRIAFASEREFLSYFSDNFEIVKGENWFIGIYPNEEEFFHFSYVNGLHMKKGGSHIDYISTEISNRGRELLRKKYKEIKPTDIKNKLSMVVFMNDFKNMKFDSQTKESLTNLTSEVRDYFKNGNYLDWDPFVKRIIQNPSIQENIVEFFKLKEEIKKKKLVQSLSGNRKGRVQSENYFPPIGEKKYLFITEGASATGGISKVLGRKGIAYYSLRGKPLNVLECKIGRLIKNQEIKDIIDILDLDLTDHDTDMSFDKVIILSDQDSDGIHIRSLMLTFFHRFSPKVFKERRICYMNTPLMIAYKNSYPEKWFFSFKEYNDWKDGKKGYEYKYYKGLGSFNKKDLDEVIRQSGSMEDFFVSFEFNGRSKQAIEKWFSNKKAEDRKDELRDREFNLFLI